MCHGVTLLHLCAGTLIINGLTYSSSWFHPPKPNKYLSILIYENLSKHSHQFSIVVVCFFISSFCLGALSDADFFLSAICSDTVWLTAQNQPTEESDLTLHYASLHINGDHTRYLEGFLIVFLHSDCVFGAFLVVLTHSALSLQLLQNIVFKVKDIWYGYYKVWMSVI